MKEEKEKKTIVSAHSSLGVFTLVIKTGKYTFIFKRTNVFAYWKK